MSMVKLSHVQYETDGQVLRVMYDWEEGKNAMDWQALESMAQIYSLALQQPDLKLIILTGSHGYFNTGGHVNTADPEDKQKYNDALARCTELKAKLDVPVLAAINGDCLAGGMMFVGEADFAVALDTAHFSFPEILHGAFPIMVMIPLIDTIPQKRAMDVFCTGRTFDANEAYEMGLLTKVTDAAHFDEAVRHYTDVILGIDRDVMRVGRRCYKEMRALPETQRKDCGMRALREVWEAKENSKKKG